MPQNGPVAKYSKRHAAYVDSTKYKGLPQVHETAPYTYFAS